ncbi:hypothetical protein AB0A93_38835, partial [Streptomyces sp. NPDC045369]
MAVGARHAWAALRHTVTTGHQSAEELRRLLVLRQLTRYERVRETAREELEEVRRQAIKSERRAADRGWTSEERAEHKALTAEITRREKALKHLLKVPFEPVQPTREQIARARRAIAARRAVALLVLCGAVAALCTVNAAFLLLVLVACAVALWWVGGRPPALDQRAIPDRLLARPELAITEASMEAGPDGAPVLLKPFPIAEAHSEEDAADTVRRGLAAEKIRATVTATASTWGWDICLVLEDGKPSDITSSLPDLARGWRVGLSRIMPVADLDDGAVVRMRILTSDPFADLPAYRPRPPRSASITDPFSLGLAMDGDETPVILAGQHMLVVAVSGGGKSMLVRAVAEFATACTDARVLDLDATGRGLGPLRPLAQTAYDDEAIESALDSVLNEMDFRTANMPTTQDEWEVSENSPALIVLIDEYTRLSNKAKKQVIKGVRHARKTRITFVVCTQDATQDEMGDAIADSFGLRVMLPCRQDDVPVVAGRGAIAAGWLPHLLTPSPGGPGAPPMDAGTFYLIGGGYKVPMLRRTLPLAPTEAERIALERMAALPEQPSRVPVPDSVPQIAKLLLHAFEAAGTPEALANGRLLDSLARQEPVEWGKWAAHVDRWKDDPKGRLREGGKAVSRALKAAGLKLSSARLDEIEERPTGYRLADLRAAVASAERSAN